MTRFATPVLVSTLVSLLVATLIPMAAVGQSRQTAPSSPDDAPETETGIAIPGWFEREMQSLIGRWVTDNSEYMSDDEPFDQYGLDWQWGVGQTSVVGRLFGLIDGEEVATFWDFRSYWHPGERKAIAFQISGSGTVGLGEMTPVAGDTIVMTQTFFDPSSGGSNVVGHKSVTTAETHSTYSFDVDASGAWKPRRSYVWYRLEKTQDDGSR